MEIFIMQITTEQIVEKIYNGFVSKYKAFGKFVDSGEYWNMCIDAVLDKTLLEHIIFCNDVLNNPPVHTFLRTKIDELKDKQLSEFEKRAVGAFWGYVFKFVFEYQYQKSVTAKVNSVRTASYFMTPKTKLK